jgi:nucleoside-diphosphate-sugar epimerase
VTGAAGFAGGHLLDLLTRAGVDVVAWHRPGGTRPPASDRDRGATASGPDMGSEPGPRGSVAWEALDLLDRTAVRAALERVRPRAVYHCPGAAHDRR